MRVSRINCISVSPCTLQVQIPMMCGSVSQSYYISQQCDSEVIAHCLSGYIRKFESSYRKQRSGVLFSFLSVLGELRQVCVLE